MGIKNLCLIICTVNKYVKESSVWKWKGMKTETIFYTYSLPCERYDKRDGMKRFSAVNWSA